MADDGKRFLPVQEAQAQDKPGTEQAMKPKSESTRLEGSDGLVEYRGAGKLRHRAIIITGGDSGIGRSVAILAAREGADITIGYLPAEQEDAEETRKLVEKEGQQCLLVPGDLMDNNACQELVEKHMEKYQKLNVLVNNASKQIMCSDIASIEMSDVESTFKSNIIQMIACTKYAVPHMKKGSSIINTSSVVAFRGSQSMIDYAATKGAIVSFTQSLHKQLLVDRGIRVNAVAPGPVHTPIQVDSRPPEQMENFGSGSMLGRAGQPSEIAPSFIFLASKDASLYSGQVLHPYPLGD